MTRFILRPSGEGWQGLKALLAESKDKVMTVEVTEGEKKKRSLDANALQHVWIGMVADEVGDTREAIERLWKLQFGLPIIMQSDSDKAAQVRQTLNNIRFDQLDYTAQLDVMRYLPVTRIMTKQEHKDFMQQVQRHYAGIGFALYSSRDLEDYFK